MPPRSRKNRFFDFTVFQKPYSLDLIEGEYRDFTTTAQQKADFSEHKQTVLTRRGRAITASIIAVCFCFVALTVVEVRRPKISVVAVFTLVLALLCWLGVRGAQQLYLIFIALHITLGSALAAAIACSLAISAVMEVEDNEPLPKPLMLTILIIPFLVVLVCGIFNTMLGMSLLHLNDMLYDESESDSSADEGAWQETPDMGDNLCKVCMARPKDAVLVPCGHQAMCLECSVQLQRSSTKCPICRQHINSVVRVFPQ